MEQEAIGKQQGCKRENEERSNREATGRNNKAIVSCTPAGALICKGEGEQHRVQQEEGRRRQQRAARHTATSAYSRVCSRRSASLGAEVGAYAP